MTRSSATIDSLCLNNAEHIDNSWTDGENVLDSSDIQIIKQSIFFDRPFEMSRGVLAKFDRLHIYIYIH